MNALIHVLLLLCLVALPAFAQTGVVVVAAHRVKMQNARPFIKMLVDTQRGERWEVVKRDKKKVALTFGPKDERRAMMAATGKVMKYELPAADFATAFVPESEWPNARRQQAAELQRRFTDLTIEQCERIVEGEYWIGMKGEHAAEVAGNRILGKETTETANGKAEVWKVAGFSAATIAGTSARDHTITGVLATPSRPRESTDAKMSRDFEQAVKVVLTLKNDTLTEIKRR
jgi:hypothetical protein